MRLVVGARGGAQSGGAPTVESSSPRHRHWKSPGGGANKQRTTKLGGFLSPASKADRYAIATRSTTSPKSFLSSPFSRNTNSNTPLIDRVPTAIGYHSDGSEDEWLDERSRCSRYDSLACRDSDELDDEDDGIRPIMSDDEPYEGDDKYAQTSKTKLGDNLTNKTPELGIERLWSDDASSASEKNNGGPVNAHRKNQQQWKKYEDQKAIDAYYQPGDVSFLSESRNDPIYEQQQSTQQKHASTTTKKMSSKECRNESRNDHVVTDKEAGDGLRDEADDVDRKLESKKQKKKQTAKKSSSSKEAVAELDQSTPAKKQQSKKKKTKQVVVHNKLRMTESKEQPTEEKDTSITAKSAQLDSVVHDGHRDSIRNTTADQAEDADDDIPGHATSTSSSLTDPMAAYMATDTLVKEIEQKLKILKKASAKEKRSAEKRIKEKKRQERQRKRSKSAAKTKRKASTGSESDPQQKESEQTSSPKSPKKDRSKSPIGRLLGKNSTTTDSRNKNHNGENTKQNKGRSSEKSSATTTKEKKNKTEAVPPPATQEQDSSKLDPLPETKEERRGLFSVPLLFGSRKRAKNGEQSKDDPPETILKPSSPQTAAPKGGMMMYTKSILTDDSETNEDVDDPPVSPEKPEMELYMQSMMTEDEASKKAKKASQESRYWNFGRSRPKATDDGRTAPVQEDSVPPKATQKAKMAASPTSKTSAGLTEMDEYSSYESSRKDEAALVQCLKFYACGIVADKVNVAIKAGDDCQPMINCNGDYDMSTRTDALTPKPTVEVVLEELDVPDDGEDIVEQPKKTKGFRLFPTKHAAASSTNSIDSSIEELQEAPDLSAASATSSFVLDVSDMNLHLDGDESLDGDDDHGEAMDGSAISLTSIAVPTQSTETEEPRKFNFPRLRFGRKNKGKR